jgi:hypothetical protein
VRGELNPVGQIYARSSWDKSVACGH